MTSNNTISILGAGESGTGAALLAKMKGYKVFVSDSNAINGEVKEMFTSKGIEFEEYGHSVDALLKSKEVIKSPGIPYSATILNPIIKAGIPIIDEIEFASRYTVGKTIAITGTNGKTTITLLLNHILTGSGLDCAAVGNVGKSWASHLTEGDKKVWVIELSSFQIEGISNFKPDIFAVSNITPDHLNRYQDMEEYSMAKLNMATSLDQSSHFIYFNDENILSKKVSELQIAAKTYSVDLSSVPYNGVHVSADHILVTIDGKTNTYNNSDISLRGTHNMINSGICALTAEILGVSTDNIKEGLSSFKTVPHRMEFVSEKAGVRYYNDSKATNLDAVNYALNSFDKPIIWIAGGVDKGNDYSEIQNLVQKKVKAVVCMGVDNSKLIKGFSGKIELVETSDIQKAVEAAANLAKSGDVVLLSPACASFDLFKNYEDRGNKFKEAVLNLSENKKGGEKW